MRWLMPREVVERVLPRRLQVCLLAALLLPIPLSAQERQIGRVSFFGQDGFDVNAIRAALPLQEGDRVALETGAAGAAKRGVDWERGIRDTVVAVIGREPTAVDFVCCDERGQFLVYIGLPGPSIRPVRFNPPPDAAVSLPDDLVTRSAEIDTRQFQAVAAGRAREDHSQGYSLAQDDPALRALQLAWRDEVRKHEERIYDVVGSSRDARHRRIAATALGYALPSDRQVDALAEASFDPDDGVRNNAVRALSVLVMGQPDRGRRIPAERFIELLDSPTWSDRNKGLMLLQGLTASRDAALMRALADVRSSLIEMAQWPKGHAVPARLILARIVGVAEPGLAEIVNEEPPARLLQLVDDVR